MIILRDKNFATTGDAYWKKVISYMNKGMSEEDAKSMLALRDAKAQKLRNLRNSGQHAAAEAERGVTNSSVEYYTKHLGTKKGSTKEMLADQRSLHNSIKKATEENAHFKPTVVTEKITSKKPLNWGKLGKGAAIGAGVAGLGYGAYKLKKKLDNKKQQ